MTALCQSRSPDKERVFLFKKQAASLLVDTPNYSCLESMDERVITTTGRPIDIDLLRVDVAVSGTNEMYAWPNSRSFSDRTLAHTLGNGFNTAGIFSNLARRLAGMDFSHIQYLGQETLEEEPVLRYSFHLPADSAPWQVASTSQNGMDIGKAGEEGQFWIDSKGLILRRIEVSATDIPRKLRLKNLHMAVDYQRVSIGDRRVLLPSSAVVKSSLKSDLDRESYIVFNHCHAFTAESTLSFGEPPPSARKPKPAARLGLPDGLSIPIELLLPISPSTADSSDVLRAVVSQTIRHRGSPIILKGAEVEGHIFRHPSEDSFAIEIDRVDTVEGWMPTYARLVSVDAPAVILNQHDYLKPRAPSADIPTPGVAIIKLTSAREIHAGTAMVWLTEALTPRISFLPDTRTCPMCFAPPPFQ